MSLIKKIRVLIVDDSALVRQALSKILSADLSIEVMATAADPFIAAQKIKDEIPDVITLDLEMPRMDGLTFLKKIMSQHPIPVVVISSLTDRGAESTLRALEYGAVEVLKKNAISVDNFIDQDQHIIQVIKAASKAIVKRKSLADQVSYTFSASVKKAFPAQTSSKIIALGASTGGTEAIRVFLEQMPVDCPGIVIVQHMPEVFTRSFAERLNQICKIEVKEASSGDAVLRGRALIAPGNKHMELRRSGARYFVELHQQEPVNRHRPSVDVLFYSVAQFAGKNAAGVIMTGMGADGAKGLLAMHEAGSPTLAQDEKSCVVYGMPKEAVKLNAVEKILPLEQLAHNALSSLRYQMA
jgi:two-component system, chemotaxis family, protein-glutamate methylesterase/glutaminase